MVSGTLAAAWPRHRVELKVVVFVAYECAASTGQASRDGKGLQDRGHLSWGLGRACGRWLRLCVTVGEMRCNPEEQRLKP